MLLLLVLLMLVMILCLLLIYPTAMNGLFVWVWYRWLSCGVLDCTITTCFIWGATHRSTFIFTSTPATWSNVMIYLMRMWSLNPTSNHHTSLTQRYPSTHILIHKTGLVRGRTLDTLTIISRVHSTAATPCIWRGLKITRIILCYLQTLNEFIGLTSRALTVPDTLNCML